MEEQVSTQKPAVVRTAVNLLWASLGIGLIKSVLDFSYMTAMAPASFTLTVLVLTVGVLAFLIYKISTGRNWARITFLVLSVLGVLPMFPVLQDELSRFPFLGLLSIIQTAIQICALYLLFAKTGAVWFRKVVPA